MSTHRKAAPLSPTEMVAQTIHQEDPSFTILNLQQQSTSIRMTGPNETVITIAQGTKNAIRVECVELTGRRKPEVLVESAHLSPKQIGVLSAHKAQVPFHIQSTTTPSAHVPSADGQSQVEELQ